MTDRQIDRALSRYKTIRTFWISPDRAILTGILANELGRTPEREELEAVFEIVQELHKNAYTESKMERY